MDSVIAWPCRSRRPAFVPRPAPPVGKSASTRSLPLSPRVVPDSSAFQGGMHRRKLRARHGSRGPDSRRGIASADFRLRHDTPGSERPPDEGRPAAANFGARIARLAMPAQSMTCGRALAVTAVATLCLTLDAYAASDPQPQESPSRRWNSNHVLRASMSLGEGDFADREGVRLSLRYDVPVRKLGSGRLLAGPGAHFMFANAREERAGRAVSHEDRMGQVGVGARYILNLKRVFQPWLAAGVKQLRPRRRAWCGYRLRSPSEPAHQLGRMGTRGTAKLCCDSGWPGAAVPLAD